MASYNVHGGHAKAGNAYSGAVGLLNESKEDRYVKSAIIKYLKLGGATVYDCTVDSGTSQRNVLEKICAKCNKHSVDMDFSIHFNSGRNDKKGDGKQGGFEIYATKYDSEKKAVADRIIKAMKNLGFGMHGEPKKTTSSLYYLNHVKNKCLLLEICFTDDADDKRIYDKIGYEKIGKAIAEAILNKSISVEPQSCAYVTASGLNLRKEASSSATVLTVITKGEKVEVVEKGSSWTKVKYENYTGYCATAYLQF